MNKIFKLIWSKTKNCWVVASELAKGHGKDKSRVKNSLLAVFVMSALLAGGVADVQALTQQEKDEVKNEVAKYLLDKIAHGGEIPGVDAERGPTNFPEAIANRIFYYNDVSSKIGEKLKHDGLTLRYFGVRPDYYEPSRDYLERYANKDWTNVDNDGAFGAHSMALGYRAFSEAKHGVAIGRSALAGGSLWKGDYGGDGGVAIGNQAWALGDKSVSVGNAARAVHKGIAIGIQAEAGLDENDNTTDWSTAPGFTPKQGKSIQYDPKTKLPYVTSDIRDKMGAIAIGIDAKAHGNHSTAMGVGAKAKSRYAWSFGYSSEASGVGSIAFGSRATAKGTNAIAIGSGNYDQPNGGAQAYSEDTIAIGRGSVAGNKDDTATAYNSVAVGREARAYGKNSVALGGTANVGDIWQKQLAEGGTAIGSSANAALENATALGYNSIAYGKDAVTLGANTRADIDGGVALGSDSNVGSYSSSSYGKAGKVGYDPLGDGADETSTWKATKAAVSVGNQQKDITRQIINVAAGTDNTDAVNVAQLKTLGRKAWKDLVEERDKLATRIVSNEGNITTLFGKVRTNTQDIGRLKTDVNTNDRRIRYLYDNMPFMHYVSVNEENTNKTTDNRRNDGAKKVGSIAIGVNAYAHGEEAVTLGYNSFSRGQGSIIIGETSDHSTLATATPKEEQFNQSIIVGSQNEVYALKKDSGGREDTILGSKNHITESHGTFVRGVGNYVADAYNDEALTDEDKQKEREFLDPLDGGDPIGLFQKGRSHVTVDGDGNAVAGAIYTRVSGVGNEISNTDYDDGRPSTPRLSYNVVTGNRNSVIDSSHNLIMGDNHELENVNGNIIIGSQTKKTKTEASNVTVLGNDANVSVEGGVALGTGSVADTAAGALGYISLNPEKGKTIEDGYKAMGAGDAYEYHAERLPKQAKFYEKCVHEYEEAVKNYEQETDAGKKRNLERTVHRAKGKMERALKAKQESEEVVSLEAAWKSTQGAVSVGGYTVDSDGIKRLKTRQITGVAAGTKDSDAVNVAQLKASTTRYFSVNEVTPKKTFKVNFPYTRLDEWGYSVHGNQINDGAKGEGAVAVGENAEALQKYGSAFGYGAKAKQEQSLALGLRAEAEGSGSVAMGGFSIVEQTGKNSLALGQHSRVTAANSVALGAESFVGTLDGIKTDAYLTGDKDKFTADNGVVSVGRTGYKKWTKTTKFDDDAKAQKEFLNEVEVPDSYRRIVNVAGGAADTDAVNVAQLKAARTTVKAGDYVTVTEGKEQNVDGTVYTVKGPTLSIDGGNLTVADAEETITGTTDKRKIGYKLSLNKELTGLTSVSSTTFKAGNDVTLGATGLTIANGPSVTTTGIDANNTTITKVAAGAADGDAVNFKQLSDVKTKVEANEGNITNNKNAIDGLTPKVTTNTANIGKLQAGFTVKDGGTGSADVTLGGDTKQEVTFKAAVDKTTQATENGSSLTSTVGTDRSVTYKLNMKQLKKDLGITDGPDGVMSSWKLKATGGDTTEQDIKNGEAVTFDVAAADKGLTVARDGKTIKYGIEGSKIDIANNQSITNLGKRIDNLPSIHYFSVKSTATGAGSNYDNDGAKKDGGIAIGKQASATGTSDIAIGTEAQATGGWGVAIGQSAKAQASTAVAMAFAAEAKGANSLAIGIQSEARTNDSTAYGREAKALGEVALAVGMRAKAEGDHSAVFGAEATTDSTAWNGTAIGRGAYIGKQAPDGTTPNIGVSDNYYTPVDDDTAVEAGKETKNSTAVGFGAKSFGYQNTALGAGAEAFDTNTVAVGVLSKAIGHYANALGKQARAEGTNSTAIGHFARALGESSMALGDYAITSTLDGTGKVNQSVALGSHARVAADNSLALGNNSLASIADDVKTEAYLSKEAFKKENGVVSVGNKEYTVGKEKIEQNYRRIINVAGGADDHDAVNVAQLKALEGKVTTNTGDITTLKEGWTLQDANTTVGTKTVKAKDTVTVTGDDYINATVNNAGLKLGMNETKLNTQINNQIDNSDTVKAKMNSWVLKATSDEGTEQNGKTINNTDNAVTFDVENDAQGLTVKRANSTIKYGIDKAKLASHITGDVITNINNGTTAVTNIAGLFSVTDGTNTKAVNLGKGKNNNVKFLGTVNETTVTVGGNDDAPTVTVGLAKEFKNKVTTNEKNIKELTGRVDTAEKTIKSNTDRIDTAEKTIKSNTDRIDTAEKTIKSNTDRIDTAEKTIKSNTDRIDTAEKTIKSNTDRIDTAEKTIKSNTDRIDTAEKTIKSNTDRIDTAEKTIKSNTAAIEKNAGDIKTLTTRVDANADNINANTEKIGKNTTAIENNTKAIAGKMTSWKLKAEGVAGEEEIKDGNAVTFDVAEKDQGLTVTRDGSTIKYGIDGSKIDIKENETVKKLEKDIENSKTTVKAGDGEKNISVSKTDGKNEYTITLAKDLKDLNSVSAKTVNADTVEASGKVTVGDKVTLGTTGLTIEKGPSVTAAGIDAGKKKITNVAAGAVSEKSTEAVNGGQLFGVEQKVNINSRNISILGGKVNELNARVDRVSAGTAALAALHPLDFDPDDKWDFAAGYGNYKGANAAAIGAYYRPNEDTMFSVGGSFGGGENMVNAGVSVKFGQGNHVTTSRIAMAKEIKDLRAEVEVLRQAVTGIRQGKTPDPVKMKLFPDIAKNHWAYEAVEKLTKQGLLEGYPDGTFGGDRMMTRYEFAEIVYRAVQKGLNVSEKLIQEFEPELERFRVDVISKDKDGNPVIERVRVNEKKRAK